MPSSWDILYEALRNSVGTAKSAALYSELRRHVPAFNGFVDVSALLEYLDADAHGEVLDHKDSVYRSLVSLSQTDDRDGWWARALVWLGLWPGLDHIYRRLLTHARASPEEVVQAISVAFLARVADVELGGVRRIASGLVRSTARDARRWLASPTTEHDAGDEAQAVAAEEDDEARAVAAEEDDEGEREPWDAGARAPAGLAASSGRTWHVQAIALRHDLARLVGDAGDVVLAIAVFERELTEIAELLETSREAMRKRYERALDQLRVDVTMAGEKRTRA